MSAERSQYSNSILVSQKPIDATEIVRVRLSQAKLLNDEFANFFKRYYGIKSSYLNELNKLVNETQDLNKNIEHSIIENQVLSKEELQHYNVDAIGHLSEIWNKVIIEIKDEISANNLLRTVVDKEVIIPLSGFTSRNKQWSEVRHLHSKLSEVAQTIEYNQDKISKYSEHPDKHLEKLQKYQSALSSANQTWDSEAPYVFEVFENTDFSRLEFLRDSLLRFITAYTDTLNKVSQSNEKTLESILNFNPEVEIERFAKVSSETSYIPKEARKAAESPQVQSHSKFGGLSNNSSPSKSKQRNASVATTATAATAATLESKTNGRKDHQSRLKLRSKVGSIFGKKKKDKKFKGGESFAESETSSINDLTPPQSRQSRTASFVSHSTTTRLPEPVAKNSPAPAAEPKFTANPLTTQSTGLSFHQAPLQPTTRNTTTDSYDSHNYPEQNINNSNSPFNFVPPKAQPAQVFNQSPLHSEQSAPQDDVNGMEHHKAPAPPPSRKTGTFGLGNIREDSTTDFQRQSIQPPPAGNRRDIQSQLFTGLNNATVDNKRLSSFGSFGESAKQLNPQTTGSSLLGPGGLFQHETFDKPGLNASIAEVINAKFKDGEQVSSQIIGEIALNFNNSNGLIQIPTKTNLKLLTPHSFDKLIPNNSFLKQIEGDEFEILPNAILGRTLGALKYSIKSSEAPIVIIPAWRFEEHQASVMLSIKLNPKIAESLSPESTVTLTNLVVSVSINGASNSALAKPQGTFNKEKSRITWRFNSPVVLNSTSEEKLIARFMTDSIASESEQGVSIKFNVDEENGSEFVTSGLKLQVHEIEEDDPFAQDSWVEIPSHKTLVSGNYGSIA